MIFGNTTPTKGWELFRGSIVRSYEIAQGYSLINQVKVAYKKGKLSHFIFSSVSKGKDPLKNCLAPGHFTSKWDIEEYIEKLELTRIKRYLSQLVSLKTLKINYPVIVFLRKYSLE